MATRRTRKNVHANIGATRHKSGCMICGKEKSGTEIKEDYVIEAMRWFKRNVTKNAKNYKIIVCNDCALQYKKLRARHVRSRSIYVGLGIVFTVVLFFVSRWSLSALAYGIGVTLFLYLLSLVSYMPAVKDEKKFDELVASISAKKV
jgi:hypothetical protein